ncbi:MAG: hypothetical protein FJW35_17800 [Acidobacteria bacterium]|nr:hypothetical protein [Acidobacteriota bacterium]
MRHHKSSRPIALTALALALALAGVASVAQVRNPLPLPDVRGYRALKCDLHIHTVFSDGEVWPTTRILEAWRDGLDVIAITDHDEYNPHKSDVSTDLARPHELAQKLAAQFGLLLVPAVEITRGDIHHNALFVTAPNAFAGLELEEALLQARLQDAFVFWNHPGWRTPTTTWLPEIDALHRKGLVQGVELVNGPFIYPEVFGWAEPKKLTMIANSDEHAPLSDRFLPHNRPVTLAFAKTADLPGLREALIQRRTACWGSGQVWGAAEWLGGLWSGSVSVLNPELKLGLKARSTTLHFQNRSAIPYRILLNQSPPWLRIASTELKPEKITATALSITENAPVGEHRLEAELEITNLHVEPGKNLIVRIPLRIRIAEQTP